MFFFCEWVRPIWLGSQIQIIPSREVVSSFHLWLSQVFQVFNQNPAVRDYATISLCCTLWIIWLHRNAFYFEAKTVNPMAAVLHAKSIIAEYFQFAQSHISTAETPLRLNNVYQVWRPPSNRTVKVNTDASFNKVKKIGCAGIIARDKEGKILFGISKSFVANSPILAEAIALREAIAVALNFGISDVIFENDCLDLIQACRGNFQIGEIKGIVQDILQYKSQFQNCGFTWVAKGGNMVAHQIAKLKMQGILPVHWRWNHPPSLQGLIANDMEQVARACGVVSVGSIGGGVLIPILEPAAELIFLPPDND